MVELTAGVEHRHDHFSRTHATLVHADRHAAPVVLDRDGSVEVNRNVDVRAVAGKVLVYRVVDRLPDEVVESRAVVHVPDVHTGALANGLEPLEHGDVARAVLGSGRGNRSGRFLCRLRRH